MNVLCMGETLLRYSTKKGKRFSDFNFDACIGGSETNIAVNLSQFGIQTSLLTRLPNNPLGDAVLQFLRGYGVDTTPTKQTDGRLGMYYLEVGSGNRTSSVIYDRAYSCMTYLKQEELDCEALFKDVDLFFVSGITTALNEEVKACVLTMIQYAKAHHITVAYDVNYRGKLWSVEAAGKALKEVLPYVDYLSAGRLDAVNFLGYDPSLELKDYYDLITKDYPNISLITSTKREIISSSVNKLTGYLYVEGKLYTSNTYHIDDIVDRVGGGDAYMAGILYGCLNHLDPAYTLEFACGSSVLKHSIFGDCNQVSASEVDHFIKNGVGRISR